MTHAVNGKAPERFKLRHTAGKDVAFEGWLLAQVDNYNPNATGDDGYVTGSLRWRERAVYLTKSGNIVCHKLGRSSVDGETDRGEVLVIRRRIVVVDTGVPGEPIELRNRESLAWAHEPIEEFFRGDKLAKDLFDLLGIADVEEID